jgi:adenine-specific DNA-methyltransferase
LKKKEDVVYNSPLNYMGGKSKMISFLKDNEPKNYTKFIDLFGGGFNVGINSKCANVTYNDINFKVRQLIEMFKDVDTYELYQFILTSIKKFGLIKNDKQPYVSARSVYNHPEPPLRDPRLLYVLILFGFQQQIRFNSSLEFNNPVGESGFNEKIFEKLISFSREIKEKNIIFCSNDFSYFEEQVDSDTFVYCDPPYLITLGSYNDGKRGFNGWGEVDEIRLLDFLSNINQSGGKFMLSNVLTHKGKTNHILETWIKQNNFKVIEYDKNSKSRDEIIVINY